MIKHFYSFIIETDNLILELDTLELAREEKLHLIELLESNLHHTIIDMVLSELSEEDKKIFLAYLHTKDHEKIWKFLHSKIKNIEDKIKKTADELKRKLHHDLQEVKNATSSQKGEENK